MGLLQSIFCSITFCVERVLTWTCCAFLLMLMMFTILMLMIYGISVGYHYAQKELASFSMSARTTTEKVPSLVARSGPDTRPIVRLVAVNRSSVERAQSPIIEHYQTSKAAQNVYMETAETPMVLLETERPPNEPEMLPHEKDLARRLIGRFRRSKNLTAPTTHAFLRPLRQTTEAAVAG